MEKIRIHIFLSGRVQGVFFRDSMQKKAKKLGVSGWVRNLKDGRLEAVLEGDENQVKKLQKWANSGPILANVKEARFEKENYTGEFSGFEIKYEI